MDCKVRYKIYYFTHIDYVVGLQTECAHTCKAMQKINDQSRQEKRAQYTIYGVGPRLAVDFTLFSTEEVQLPLWVL